MQADDKRSTKNLKSTLIKQQNLISGEERVVAILKTIVLAEGTVLSNFLMSKKNK